MESKGKPSAGKIRIPRPNAGLYKPPLSQKEAPAQIYPCGNHTYIGRKRNLVINEKEDRAAAKLDKKAPAIIAAKKIKAEQKVYFQGSIVFRIGKIGRLNSYRRTSAVTKDQAAAIGCACAAVQSHFCAGANPKIPAFCFRGSICFEYRRIDNRLPALGKNRKGGQ